MEIAMKNKSLPSKIKIGKHARRFLEQLTPAERRAIMNEFITAVQKGTLLEQSKPVDLRELKKEEPEVYQHLMDALKEQE